MFAANPQLYIFLKAVVTLRVVVAMSNLAYGVTVVIFTLGIFNTTAVRWHLGFVDGAKNGKDDWPLSSYFHTRISLP